MIYQGADAYECRLSDGSVISLTTQDIEEISTTNDKYKDMLAGYTKLQNELTEAIEEKEIALAKLTVVDVVLGSLQKTLDDSFSEAE